MISTILVPLDGSVEAERAVEQAGILARPCDAEVVLLSIIHPAVTGRQPFAVSAERLEARRYLAAVAHHLEEEGIKVTALVEQADTWAHGILHEIRSVGADLIVLSASSEGGPVEHLSPSTVHSLMTQAFCPVLALRSGAADADRAAPCRLSKTGGGVGGVSHTPQSAGRRLEHLQEQLL